MNNLGTSNITNENLLLIIILNGMYNDNNRQIQNLTHHNNQILNILTNMLNTNNSRRNNRYQYNRNTNTNRNNTNTNRVFLNNRPYIIDSIQAQNIPRSYLPILSENTPQQRTRTSELFNMFTNFFDPIVIHPTPSQIETATRRVRYCHIVSPINRCCPISLENFNDNDMVTVIRFCGHIFNTDHLNTWFQNNCKCPVCRYDIRNYNSSVNNSSFYNETNNPINNQQTTNNSHQNNSSETNDERNNITGNQPILNLFEDISGNLIFDSSDPQIILNLLNSLQRR